MRNPIALLAVLLLGCGSETGGSEGAPADAVDVVVAVDGAVAVDAAVAVDSATDVGSGDIAEASQDIADTGGAPLVDAADVDVPLVDAPDTGATDAVEDATPDTADTPDVPPVDPFTVDSDRDGVTDGQEGLDGTDPADPSSALAWHPEVDTWPRLFFGPDQVPELSERAKAESGPYQTLYSRVVAHANATPPEPDPQEVEPYLSGTEPTRALIAESAAFVALVEGSAPMADKAAGLLLAPFPPTGELPFGSKYDLYEAEAMVSYCQAFDFLAGSGLLEGDALLAVRANLEARIDSFRETVSAYPMILWLQIEPNNHSMKVQGAMGLCAMVLNHRPSAAYELNEAITSLDYVLRGFQATPEGGYAEGWNYLSYGGNSTLPFMAAYHRLSGGETLPYRALGITANLPYPNDIINIADFGADPSVHEIYERAVWSARPDGLTAPTDDANPSGLHGAVVSWMFSDPVLLWSWLHPAVGLQSSRMDAASFALLDPDMVPTEPTWPLDGCFPEAGIGVLRSDLLEGAVLLELLGEHGKVRTSGLGHEHADATSFFLHAFGEELLLDPGYINWDNHDKVLYAKDHNLILVDGEGPPVNPLPPVGVDAFLVDCGGDAALTHMTSTATWKGVTVTRRVARVDGRYFVVDDRLEGDGPHVYTYQLNGNGGAETDGSFEPLGPPEAPIGARWDRPAASVLAAVVPTAGAATYGSREEEHAITWGAWESHMVLTVEAPMDAHAGYLSILYPVEAGAETPAIEALATADGTAALLVHAEVGDELVIVNRTAAPTVVSAPFGAVTAGPGLLLQRRSPSGELVWEATLAP